MSEKEVRRLNPCSNGILKYKDVKPGGVIRSVMS